MDLSGFSNNEIERKIEEEDNKTNRTPEGLKRIASRLVELVEYLEQFYDGRDDSGNNIERQVFEKFSDLNNSMIGELLNPSTRKKNLKLMTDMIQESYQVLKGQKTRLEADKNVSNKVFSEFVYPKYGGKKKFEEKVKKNIEKENKK
jgi:hypothetical protein